MDGQAGEYEKNGIGLPKQWIYSQHVS